MKKNICIAVDAMGGDLSYEATVPACLAALDLYPHLNLILTGNEETLLSQIEKTRKNWDSSRLRIQHTTQVVTMDEMPSVALRGKKDSSMRVAINLIHQGEADACVSSGNTGALMATARFVLKMLPGVDRPAILFPLPSTKSNVHMLDLGANVECQADHLFQFAVMGSVLVSSTGTRRPTVGLLNVGTEAIKGTDAVKQAGRMLESAEDINYAGFVEGDDIYKGTVDVVVCDGFVGNVALKASEGVAKMMIHYAKQEFKRNIFTKLAALLATPILKKLFKRFDPNKYNGASLLGLQGVVIKSHGGANQEAFLHAISKAIVEVENNVPDKIKEIVGAKLGDSDYL